MGSLLSVYGCFQYKKQHDQVGNDAEKGLRSPLVNGGNDVLLEKRKVSVSKTLRSCVHLFQIIFQVDTVILWLCCNFSNFVSFICDH